MKRLPLRLRSFYVLGGLFACLLSWALPARVSADIGSEAQAVMQDRLMHRAKMGIEVLRLGNSPDEAREVFALEATTPFMPASNLKVVTTSAALDRLGADFKFRTLLVKHDDDLIIVGDGDPTFGDADYLKKVGWKITTVFENWAALLKKFGVTSPRDLLIDDSVFDQAFFHPHWPANQADFRYMAEVGGMNLNANLVDLLIVPSEAPGGRVGFSLEPGTRYINVLNSCVTGTQNGVIVARETGTNNVVLKGQTPSRGPARVSVTIHDPPMYAATTFADTLAASGIKLTGSVKRERTIRQQRQKDGPAGAAHWTVLAAHETPISAVIARANKDSINLYAESLCKRIGYESVKATGQSGSWDNGTAAVGQFLQHVGVPDSEFHLDDGCGLSRQDGISPRGLTRVLAYDYYGKNRQVFMDSLSIAGTDGTLEDRFQRSDLRQRILGKSGFIEGVSTLTGFLHAKDGQWYVFSIMMNGIPPKTNGEVKLLQERIVKAIDAQVR